MDYIDLILALAAAAIEGKRLAAVHQVTQLVDRLEYDGDVTSADRLRRVLAESGTQRSRR